MMRPEEAFASVSFVKHLLPCVGHITDCVSVCRIASRCSPALWMMTAS